MFFFNSKENRVSVFTDSSKSRNVLPDPQDAAAVREVEIQRFKWNAFLASKPGIFEEDWLWENRLVTTARDGPIKKKFMQIFNSKVKLRKQVKALVRSGVPPELRGRVWFACSGAAKKQRAATGTEQYSMVVNQIPSLEGSQIAADIEKDLLRTFPELIAESDQEMIEMLRRVLMAYALRNPSIGYCQSMNYLCALLLFHLEEERAYWTFAALIEDILPNNYYVPSLLGGRVDQQVFQSCIASKLPRLFEVFKSTNTLLEPIICPWFLCLYVNVLPLYAVCRVWDCLFWEGNIVLFRIGLTLIKSKSNYILQATDFISVYGILKANNLKQYSFELESAKENVNGVAADGQVMSDTEFMICNVFGFRWLKSVPTAKVELLRKKFTDIIVREEEKRLKPRKKPTPPMDGDDSVHTVDNVILKQPTSPSSGKRGRRKSELMSILLAEKDVNNLHQLALQMDEGLGSHVEELAKELDKDEDEVGKGEFAEIADSDDDYAEGEGDGEQDS